MTSRLIAITALALLLGSCASPSAVETVDPSENRRSLDPATRFDDMEERLLAAETLSFDFAIQSTGAFESSLSGSLEIQAENIHWQAQGHFGGKALELSLQADSKKLVLKGALDSEVTLERPEKLKEAILLGLTRMGLLHNLAVLTSNHAPDGSNGGFRSFASCFCFSYGLDSTGLSEAPDRIRFALFIRGAKAADVNLALGVMDFPSHRSQTVSFDSGTMTVDESYNSVVFSQGGLH